MRGLPNLSKVALKLKDQSDSRGQGLTHTPWRASPLPIGPSPAASPRIPMGPLPTPNCMEESGIPETGNRGPSTKIIAPSSKPKPPTHTHTHLEGQPAVPNVCVVLFNKSVQGSTFVLRYLLVVVAVFFFNIISCLGGDEAFVHVGVVFAGLVSNARDISFVTATRVWIDFQICRELWLRIIFGHNRLRS